MYQPAAAAARVKIGPCLLSYLASSMLCLEQTFLGLPCATGHHEKHLNFLPPYANMKLVCLTIGKICHGPGSVSQWENLQWSQLCFTMGKFAMILALFHNGKICNETSSVSQWENLQ
jgi:hypothetical protein